MFSQKSILQKLQSYLEIFSQRIPGYIYSAKKTDAIGIDSFFQEAEGGNERKSNTSK